MQENLWPRRDESAAQLLRRDLYSLEEYTEKDAPELLELPPFN